MLMVGLHSSPTKDWDELQVLGGPETTVCLPERVPVPGCIISLQLGLTHSPTQLPLALHTH